MLVWVPALDSIEHTEDVLVHSHAVRSRITHTYEALIWSECEHLWVYKITLIVWLVVVYIVAPTQMKSRTIFPLVHSWLWLNVFDRQTMCFWHRTISFAPANSLATVLLLCDLLLAFYKSVTTERENFSFIGVAHQQLWFSTTSKRFSVIHFNSRSDCLSWQFFSKLDFFMLMYSWVLHKWILEGILCSKKIIVLHMVTTTVTYG